MDEMNQIDIKKLIDGVCEKGSPDLLKILFNAKIRRWKYWVSVGDSTNGTFADLEQVISPDIAFNLIPTSVEIVLAQTDSDVFITALSLVDGLARASNTTEIPMCLQEKWDEVKQKASKIEDKDCDILIDSIEAWYRHSI